ncbi:hypothetical protein NFI96_008863 [Prochilodus magdalenae]|nr:hypothetical protein NFI96_008863 [Prochilodus magdalenae]
MISEVNMEAETKQTRHSSSSESEEDGTAQPSASLEGILREIKEFGRNNRQQLADIKQELSKTNKRLDEAEGRIEETEQRMTTVETVLKRVIQQQAALEAGLLDQEGRSRRENIRVYGIPENAEGSCMFQSARMKEDVLRRAWQKKEIFFNNSRFFVDHDYPPAVLKKRMEYAEAKRELKSKKIRFQTPFPAKLRVFYEDGVKVYQTATEATRDMVKRGLAVKVVHTSPTLLEEIERLFAWQVTEKRGRGKKGKLCGLPEEHSVPMYKEKLHSFRRRSPERE